MKYIFLLFLILNIWMNILNAQSSSPNIISTVGGTYNGNSIQIDWTVGEVAITTIENLSRKVTQGIRQSRYFVTNTNETLGKYESINVYPNPAVDRIEVEFNFEQTQDVKIYLTDLYGKIIWNTGSRGVQIKKSI